MLHVHKCETHGASSREYETEYARALVAYRCATDLQLHPAGADAHNDYRFEEIMEITKPGTAAIYN